MHSPQQEIFNLCRQIGTEILDNVHISRPLSEVILPFIVIGEQQTVENANKSIIIPTVIQTMNIFADNKKQGTARNLANQLKHKLRQQRNTKHFYIDVKNIRERTVQDNSTQTPLFRIILEVDFILY